MSHEQARQFINEASEAIRQGQFDRALQSAESSIALDASDSEAFVLRAVAYAHLNEPGRATDSFREAISLAPHNQKAFYNFAVHLYGIGEKGEALEMAREALRLDEGHQPSRELLYRIERETGAAAAPGEAAPPPTMRPPSEIPANMSAPPTASQREGAYYRGGYYAYEQPVHSLAFIEKMGKAWDVFGWVLVGLGFLGFCFEIYMMSRVFNNMGQFSGANIFQIQQRMGSSIGLGLLLDVVRFVSIIWMILDISDRRENWLWILPNIVACCCFGFNWVIVGIYILFGRSSR